MLDELEAESSAGRAGVFIAASLAHFVGVRMGGICGCSVLGLLSRRRGAGATPVGVAVCGAGEAARPRCRGKLPVMLPGQADSGGMDFTSLSVPPPPGAVPASRRCASHSGARECASCRAAGQMASESFSVGCGGCGAPMAVLHARVVMGCGAPLAALAPRPPGTADIGALWPYLKQQPRDHHGAKRRTTRPKPGAHPTLCGHHGGSFFEQSFNQNKKLRSKQSFGKAIFINFTTFYNVFFRKRLNYITISSKPLAVCALAARACSCCRDFTIKKFALIEISCFDR